jgi:isoquinoline 1-oxidoreductase beta subunit
MGKQLSTKSGKKNGTLSRRQFLEASTAGSAAFVLGFYLPPKAALAQSGTETTSSANPEVNAWVVIEPDDTVIIRIAQTELGQGVWTSNAMMVCEELQCDWSKVRPTYASVNRDGREMAPAWTLDVPGNGAQDPAGGGLPEFRDRQPLRGIPDSLYRRMRTNAAASVRDGRYYLQLAGAEARERLLLAAANLWSVPVNALTAKDSVITHTQTGNQTTYGQIAHLAAATSHPDPESITIKPPDQWTLMGTEQPNLDIPARHAVGGGENLSGLRR